ncbi:unnamed protein product [Urochloa decumbens]|uniref:Uncharacterized protein n=1 Tax=Urochloa decumbens TaxID=240449 RepID=A0ABC9E8X5_9POAL
MEAAPRKHETTRGEPAAAVAGDVGGGQLGGALQPPVVIVRYLRAVALFLFWACLGGLAALLRRLIELEAVRRLEATAFFLFRGRCSGGLAALLRPLVVIFRCLRAAALFLFRGCYGGIGGALRQLIIEPGDRRLQAATFFLASGVCTVLSGTALNQPVNPEHIFAGFFLINLGAAMAILTLAGAGPGRAAAQTERFLRDFF